MNGEYFKHCQASYHLHLLVACYLDIAELPPEEAQEIKDSLFRRSGKPHGWSRPTRTEMEESMRVPLILAYKLRCCIDSGETRLSGKPDAYRFFNLFGAVDSFMESYFLLRKQMTTPFPFPMEQMNRTFLYFYIFTVPLTLLEDVKGKFRASVMELNAAS
jgi:hypothetical protein